ncbi:acyl carrier protein [Candidatus Parcubacteria bacterium]|nr:acyl carrier protein [Candidatus Parcubacteria bacterium]
MKEADINQKIKEIFIDIFPELKKEKFNFNKRQEEFENWDSFSHMELVARIEEVFGITMDIVKIINSNSPKLFVDIIKNSFK